MMTTFRSSETEAGVRAAALGIACRPLIHRNLAEYTRLFDAVGVPRAQLRHYGEEAVAQLAAWAPSLHQELLGLATGAQAAAWELGMLNARTEILAMAGSNGIGECTAAVYLPPGGPPRSIQTWDWHDALDGAKVMAAHPAAGGRTVRYFTEAGLLGKIGLSTAGLGLHFNILEHAADGGRIGVPVHAVARRILDEAVTLDDAIAIARSAAVSASTVLTVTTFDGRNGCAASIELSPAGVAVVPADHDGYLVHTNHFLDPVLAQGQKPPSTDSTFQRYDRTRQRRELLATPHPDALVETLLVHEADGAAVCRHADLKLPFQDRAATLLTIELDLGAGELRYLDGGPCRAVTDGWQVF